MTLPADHCCWTDLICRVSWCRRMCLGTAHFTPKRCPHSTILRAFALSRPWHVAVPLMCLTVRRVLPRYQHFRLELTEFCYWKGRAQLVRQYGGSLELRVDSVRFFWTGIKEIMHDVTVQVQDWWQRYTQNQPALRELANGVIDLVTMCVSHGTPPPYHSWC